MLLQPCAASAIRCFSQAWTGFSRNSHSLYPPPPHLQSRHPQPRHLQPRHL